VNILKNLITFAILKLNYHIHRSLFTEGLVQQQK